eukprot:COSAG05_NODE_4541_length_1471_cov_1.416181_2_plen_183_part_00
MYCPRCTVWSWLLLYDMYFGELMSCVIAASQSGAASNQLASSGHTPAVCHPDLLHSGSDHSHRRSTSKDWRFQHARPCLQKLLASPGRGRGADVNSGRADIAGVGRAASGGGERPPPLCPHLSWMPLAYLYVGYLSGIIVPQVACRARYAAMSEGELRRKCENAWLSSGTLLTSTLTMRCCA